MGQRAPRRCSSAVGTARVTVPSCGGGVSMKHMWPFLMVCLLTASAASGQTVKLKKAWDDIEAKLGAKAKDVKTACGAEIEFGWNKASWDTIELVEKPARWCAEIAGT